MGGKSAAAAGQVAKQRSAPATILLPRPILLSNCPNAFAVQPAVPGFVPSNVPTGRSRSRRRNCGRKDRAEPGVPRSPGLRNRNSTGARSHAARYGINSTPVGAVRFEPAQLRVAAAAPFLRASRSRQSSPLRPHPGQQELGRGCRDAGPLQHPDLPLLGAELGTHGGDLAAQPVELLGSHSALRSSGTSPNFRISFASLKSPLEGSPVRENAMAPA